MIENYQNLLNHLQAKMNEYHQNGESAKALKIQKLGQYLSSNYQKINPNVREAPAVLDKLRVEIERGVASFNTVDDKFELNIQDDGSLQVIREDAAYNSSTDGRKTKDTSVISFNQLSENPKYVSITTSQAITKDGVAQDASDFDKLHIKSESDITYTKEVYSPEGLQIQGTTAHTIRKDNMNTLDSSSNNYIAYNMSMYEPTYSTLNGYSPRNNSGIHYDKMFCSTRGTRFGDDQNIGMYTLLQKTQKDGSLVETTSSFEPVSFTAMGPYLDYEHQAEGISITPTPDKTYNQIEAEAITKFGGEKGWEELLSASEHRAMPQSLKDYASNKIQNRNQPQSQYTIGKSSFGNIANAQRTGAINTQTTHIQNDIQRLSNPNRDMNNEGRQ